MPINDPDLTMNQRTKPILAITMGDVNGIGPEILAKALACPEVRQICCPLVVGDRDALERARTYADGFPTTKTVTIEDLASLHAMDRIPIYDAGITAPPINPGHLDPEAGRAAVEWTIAATKLVIAGVADAIVTCPINKEGIHRAGYHYNGHTELIAELAGAEDYKMSLFAGNMRIVHITTHLSLRDAIAEVKTERILTTLRVAHAALVRLGLPKRRIAVAGLNPHAGEAGAFGREEIDEIEPAIRAGQAEGIDCSGPYPADTIFRRMRDGEFELVVAMYHDQGHVPLKLIAMDEGVNVTLGMPIIRTSVDHGTAYEIAGTGAAREDSLLAALRLAAEFAQRRPSSTT